MAFRRTRYLSDSGDIHPARLSAEFAAEAGAPPSGAPTTSASARSIKSSRQYGLRMRGWRLFRIIGAPPNTFVRYAFLPKLTPTAYDAAPAASIEIGGNTWSFLRRIPEDAD